MTTTAKMIESAKLSKLLLKCEGSEADGMLLEGDDDNATLYEAAFALGVKAQAAGKNVFYGDGRELRSFVIASDEDEACAIVKGWDCYQPKRRTR